MAEKAVAQQHAAPRCSLQSKVELMFMPLEEVDSSFACESESADSAAQTQLGHHPLPQPAAAGGLPPVPQHSEG